MEYSPEELNYFRILRIVVKLIPAGLRKIFKQEWDFLYSGTLCGIWQDTAQNGSDFYHEETKGKKKTGMNGRFLSIVRNGNTAEWDCSCLFSAILSSNTIGSSLGPVVRTAVDDLRQVRNDLAHITDDELNDGDFQNYATRALHAFTSLGLSVSEIEDVRNQTGFPTEEVKDLKNQLGDLKTELDQTKSDLAVAKEENKTLTTELDQTKSDLNATSNTLHSTQADLSSAKEENESLTQELSSKIGSFCSLTFSPPHEIIRRFSDVRKIADKMRELNDGSNGAVSTIYLSGNPGCGKSQLARQIGEDFYSLKSRSTEDLVFVATLNAENLETIAASYVALAKKLGITEYAVVEMEKSITTKPEATLKQVMCMIPSKIAKFANWLIIVDNVIDLRLVRSYVPQTASTEWGRGQVLITTQDSGTVPSNAPHTYHQSLSEGMQPNDAVELLNKVSQISDQEQVDMVAEVLEYQPLALAAAAYFVKTVVNAGSPMYSWKNYLHRLRQGQREATEEPLAKESSAYSNTMTTAVKMAIGRAMETNEVLRQTFFFLSLCASDSLPVEVVVEFVVANSEVHTVKELVKADILKSSLIVSLCEENGGSRYIRLHSIVHEVLRTIPMFDSDSTRKHCIATAIDVFESSLNESLLTMDYGTRKLGIIASHSKMFCDMVLSDYAEKEVASALAFIVPAVKVISWVRYMATACWLLSEPSHAKRFCEFACDLFQNVSSSETEICKLKSDVFELRGRVFFDLCEYQSALFYFQEALMIKKKIYGSEEDGSTAGSYDFLGEVCRAMGRYDQANEFFEKALEINKKLASEEERRHLGSIYNNMAANCRDIGEYSEAIKYDEKALSIRKNIHGEDNVDVAHSYTNLAVDYENIGRYRQAIECDKKALSINMKIHGEKHSDVAHSYNNLAENYRRNGEYDQAIKCDLKALSIRKAIHGEEIIDVANSYNNLGDSYRRNGEYKQATECDLKALGIRKKIYGEEHVDVASSFSNMADTYRKTGEYNLAIEYDKKALRIRKKLHGEEHSEVAHSYNNLAESYRKNGEYDKAIECDRRALAIRRNVFGEEDSHVADSCHNLAIDYSDTGEYDQAIEYDNRALNIRKKIYGEEHGVVAHSYNNLAERYRKKREYHQAIEYDRRALSIRRNISGEEDSRVADSCCNLGLDYRETGEFDQAIRYEMKALKIQIRIHGEEHGDVADCYQSLAIVHSMTGDYEKAIGCRKEALRLRKKIHGEKHGDVVKDYEFLALLCDIVGEYDQAKEFKKKVLSLRGKISGEKHDSIAES